VGAAEEEQVQGKVHVQAQEQVQGKVHVQAQEQVQGKVHVQAQEQVQVQVHVQPQEQVQGKVALRVLMLVRGLSAWLLRLLLVLVLVPSRGAASALAQKHRRAAQRHPRVRRGEAAEGAAPRSGSRR
jgi:hypothetical protein